MNTIGNRIRNKRIELDITQQELADKLGYTNKSAISRIERGITDIPQKKLSLFAEALNTTVPYLTGDAPETSEALSETKKELIRTIEALSDRKAQKFLELLKEYEQD